MRRSIGLLLLLAGCDSGTQAGGDGGACETSSLIAQCPAGSNPLLGASAASSCESAAGGIVQDGTSVSPGGADFFTVLEGQP